jgi:hypothetical protein
MPGLRTGRRKPRRQPRPPKDEEKRWQFQNGCLGVTRIDGSPGTGPTWFNLYGRQEQLSDGTVVIADDAYIHESILQPQAKIVAGYRVRVHARL